MRCRSISGNNLLSPRCRNILVEEEVRVVGPYPLCWVSKWRRTKKSISTCKNLHIIMLMSVTLSWRESVRHTGNQGSSWSGRTLGIFSERLERYALDIVSTQVWFDTHRRQVHAQ